MKKLILTAASVVALTAAVAANADSNLNSVQASSPVYVEVNGGLLHTGLEAKQQSKELKNTKWEHGNYGYTVGGDFGYNATQHLGAEFGGYWMNGSSKTGNITLFNTTYSGKTALGSRYMMYAAGTLRAQVATNLTVMAKAGMAYDHQKATLTTSQDLGNLKYTGTAHRFSPIFAVAGQYSFGPNLYMTAQWTHVVNTPKAPEAITATTPKAWGNADAAKVAAADMTPKDLFTVGLGYRFNI